MKAQNPMRDSAAVEKMQIALKGRTFLARGGNGKTTPEQEMLASLLGLPMEYPIPTTSARSHFQSLPN